MLEKMYVVTFSQAPPNAYIHNDFFDLVLVLFTMYALLASHLWEVMIIGKTIKFMI